MLPAQEECEWRSRDLESRERPPPSDTESNASSQGSRGKSKGKGKWKDRPRGEQRGNDGKGRDAKLSGARRTERAIQAAVLRVNVAALFSPSSLKHKR